MDGAVAFIGLGSNLGDRKSNMRAAVKRLAQHDGCEVVKVSSLYETRPVGVEAQPNFLNAVIELRTRLSPDQLLDACFDVERILGRTRTFRWGPRVIDVDILLYDGVSVNKNELVIPHPRLTERAFVLVPLAEIAPEADIGGGTTAAQATEIVGDEGVRIVADSTWAQ